jgi:hypothetical protein
VRRLARALNRPDVYLTDSELLVFVLANLVALVLGLAAGAWWFALAAPAWPVPVYRSQRRLRAARRVALDGFVEQAPRVEDEERKRKVAALRDELGDWPPGLRWLSDVDARAGGRPHA